MTWKDACPPCTLLEALRLNGNALLLEQPTRRAQFVAMERRVDVATVRLRVSARALNARARLGLLLQISGSGSRLLEQISLCYTRRHIVLRWQLEPASSSVLIGATSWLSTLFAGSAGLRL